MDNVVKKEEIRISVRNLVEFILRSGDIDNRHQGSPENAMQEGGRIHRMIQKNAGADYKAEVPLKYYYETDNYILVVEGRADGIISNDRELVIDEIKGTYRDIQKMRGPIEIHLAQAKCYAYIQALKEERTEVKVRMTYCNMESEEIRYFNTIYSFEEISKWFLELIEEYKKWADFTYEWKQLRQVSLEHLEFPFPYREGQKQLVSYVYQTIFHKRKLYLEAPTGVGKTISTVFPALKAMEKGMAEKIFYLTAKTITRTVADDTIQLLRKQQLRLKSVVLTAKEKICFAETVECNPEQCPYAKGHFDRINEAIYELLTNEDNFNRDVIERFARKYKVCPFEFCLDMSLFADAVICDYNYLFDPHVYLKRFFAEGVSGNYIFLIDEAHNLLERGREMYSAVLVKENIQKLKYELIKCGESEEFEHSVLVKQGYQKKLDTYLEKCNKEMLALKRECNGYAIVSQIDVLVNLIMRIYSILGDYLEEQEEQKLPIRELLLDFYFDVAHFLLIYDCLDENYVKYTQICEDDSFMLKLFCVNPKANLKECMQRGRSSILFSATFLPIQYYKSLLGGEKEDYEVYAKSVFDPHKKLLVIANDVTSKYTRRSENEFYNIAKYIDEIVKNRHGNYMVFCPSYAFLERVYDVYVDNFENEEKECIIQLDYMSEEGREAFLRRFQGNGACDLNENICMDIEIEEETTLIGFCVLGGVFGEGIDLKNDSLIGAIIVGTGLPQVCYEREIVKNYFDEEEGDGFDYSYRYPGMNKVLQAAGRVIRTVEDVGVVALLDERFLQYAYLKLFPREWEEYEVVTVNSVAKKVEHFWDFALKKD